LKKRERTFFRTEGEEMYLQNCSTPRKKGRKGKILSSVRERKNRKGESFSSCPILPSREKCPDDKSEDTRKGEKTPCTQKRKGGTEGVER